MHVRRKTTATMCSQQSLVLMALLMGGASGAALSQETANSLQLEEITVTARKTSETLQSVPIAITAFSAEDIEERRIFDIKSLGEITPGLISAGDNQRGFPVIRGMTTRSPASGSEGAVGQYIDEVYQPRFSNQLTTLLDLERIEVLKGPQGTLYGRNTIAGAINYVSRKPTDEFSASMTAGIGNMNLYEARARVSGPLVEGKLKGGLSGMLREADGFLKVVDGNLKEIGDDGSSDYGFRGALEWTPTDALSINLTGMRVHTGGASLELAEGNPSGPTATAIARLRLYTPSAVVADYRDYKVAQTDVGKLRRTSDQVSLRVDWELSDTLTLTSLSAYQKFDEEIEADADLEIQPLAWQFINEDSDTYSQELRLAADYGRFRLNVGANYFYDSHFREEIIDVSRMLAAPFNVVLYSSNDVDTTSWAVFSQGYFDLTDKFKLTAGVRYSKDEREYRKVTDNGNPAFGPTFDSDTVPGWDTNPSWDDVSYTGSLDYSVTNDLMVYGSYSKGYRSGGIQGRAQTLAASQFNYGPETAQQYELGAKSKFADGRVRMNLALYYIDYRDVQVSQVSLNTFFGGAVIQNAGAAEMKGAELESIFKLGDFFTLELSYAYNDSTFKDYVSTDNISGSIALARGCPTAFGCRAEDYVYDGVPLEFAPENAVTSALTFAHALGENKTLSVRGEYNWKDEYLLNVVPQSIYALPHDRLEDEFLIQPAVAVVNGFVSYGPDDERWKLELWGRNLTDERIVTIGSDVRTVTSGQFNKFKFGDRRAYGANVTFQF